MSEVLPSALSELLAIERRRTALGMTRTALERAAGLAGSYYSKLLSGACAARPGTLARLKMALQRFALRQSVESDDDYTLSVAYRLAVAMAAQALAEDPRIVQQELPGRRATQSAAWMRAAEVRRLAVYLMNAGCGFNQAEVARAAGMTRQAVSLACRALEEKREDKDFDRMLDELTAAVMGEW